MAEKKKPSSLNKTVDDVVRALDGTVLFDLVYLPPAKTMQAGYVRLREILLWAQDKIGRPLPPDVAELVKWIRDHFGGEDFKRAAIEKHRGTGSSKGRLAGGTSPASSSSPE